MLVSGALYINRRISIPRSEIRFKFTRSSGHGGQNINKVETRVELYFNAASSPSLAEEERKKVLDRLATRIDKDGVLRLTVQKSRSQRQNRDIAVSRFIELLQHALRPVKKRAALKTPARAHLKRLERKKRRGEIKSLRRRIPEDLP